MTPAESAAAEALYKALSLFPCTCRFEHPYNIAQGNQVHHCHRCKALNGWLAVRCEPLRAELAAGRVP